MRVWLMAGAVACAVAAGVAALRASQGESIQTVGLQHAVTPAPAMCPWREPKRDLQAFFPGATEYRTDLLVLSRLRTAILARLGPGGVIESNALYVYRALDHGGVVGTVLVRRVAGQYGAVEVVVAVKPDGTVAGARVQRQREPREVAGALTDHHWLASFRGKTADDPWRLGQDVPPVPAAARRTAEALLGGIRSLLIEYQAAAAAIAPPHPDHTT